ncbi:MAG TPA: class I SAM-dependent methyltransferase [Methylomirabilota bacterium]|nr:class I SAM-dependent methyltransferase [Methylomirabilota bacterium]
MDPRTVQFYGGNAADLAHRYAAAGSAAARYFPVAFTPGSRILDVGCGSGRDLNALIDAGYNATGVDACDDMLLEARIRHPAIANRLTVDTLPNLSGVPDASYEGLLCWAVLMHLPGEFLFDTVFNLRRVLKPGGRLLISTPLEGPVVEAETHRDAEGRLFNSVTPENFHFLFEKVGFRRLNRWDEEDSLGRRERRWATQLFVLEGHGSRSLDKIEAILNRDKKDATYKPALFRALAERRCHGASLGGAHVRDFTKGHQAGPGHRLIVDPAHRGARRSGCAQSLRRAPGQGLCLDRMGAARPLRCRSRHPVRPLAE